MSHQLNIHNMKLHILNINKKNNNKCLRATTATEFETKCEKYNQQQQNNKKKSYG